MTLDRSIGLVALAWFAALVGLPGMLAWPPGLWITGPFILINLAASLAGLYYSRRLFVVLTVGQVALLSVVHVQVYAVLGADFYRCYHVPGWWDWLAFSGAHVLKAADALDFLEEYGIHLHNGAGHHSKANPPDPQVDGGNHLD